jgi:hypothetical protein
MRQMYLHFSDVHKRLCYCKSCSDCKKRERGRRYRLRKFLGTVNKQQVINKQEDNIEEKMINYFKEKGWD